MKSITAVLISSNILKEIDRLNGIADLEQQGYETGPVLCELLGIDPAELLRRLDTLVESDDIYISERDRGLERWCNEQIAVKH